MHVFVVAAGVQMKKTVAFPSSSWAQLMNIS
jgi:hypothetical protein